MRQENGAENVVCRSWGEGMEAVVTKRGGTGRKRMTGAGEDGEREARCAVEWWVIGLVVRFGLIGGCRHPGNLPLQPSSDINI
jgi:hypothetical protein